MSGNNLIFEAKLKYSVIQIKHRLTPVCYIHRDSNSVERYMLSQKSERRSAALQRNMSCSLTHVTICDPLARKADFDECVQERRGLICASAYSGQRLQRLSGMYGPIVHFQGHMQTNQTQTRRRKVHYHVCLQNVLLKFE